MRKKEFDAAQAAAVAAVQTVSNYEKALVEMQRGNYAEAAALMSKDSVYRWKHVKDIKAISEEEQRQLKADLDAKRMAVDTFRKEYEKGTEGFTQPMLAEMEASLAELAGLWSKATGEAYDCGVNLGLGLVNGIDSTTGKVVQIGQKVINAALNSMKSRAKIASPSKVTTGYGQFLGIGLGLGLEDEEGFVADKAGRLMQKTLSAMDGYSVGTAAPRVSTFNNAAAAAPVSISITVHADTDDLGDRISAELQTVLDRTLAARGNGYRTGRSDYAY